jgi:hypothetical protein
MAKRYEMLSDSKIEPAATKGTIVYSCHGCDYGCANDDTRMTGVEHTSMTLNEDGSYPFFTHPRHMLKPLED